MKRSMKLWSITALFAALTFGAARADAGEGMLARAAQIPPAARAALQKDIEAERAARPQIFAAVRSVRGIRPEVYRTYRNPQPNATSELRALGKGALLPMLAEIAFDAQATAGLSEKERSALAAGLLEAVGLIRDPRSGPVLKAAFEGGTKDPVVLRAAAEALGRLCGDAELGTLSAHVAGGDPLRDAAIRGLAHCRRQESAQKLASLLAAATDAAEAEHIASALGIVGSSWAWKALGPAAEAPGLAVREIAARALVAAIGRHAGTARARIAGAMVMVDHPVLPALLANVRASAAPDLAVVIDDVRKQLGKP